MQKQTPLVISPDISVASPSFKNQYDTSLTKWPEMSKVCKNVPQIFQRRSILIKLFCEMYKMGLIFEEYVAYNLM